MFHFFEAFTNVYFEKSSNPVVTSETTNHFRILRRNGCIALIGLLVLICLPASVVAKPKAPKPHNILFIIMDDVGMDQMAMFGYGGTNVDDPDGINGRPAELPNIDDIAVSGVAFRNTWSMPACSTSRAVFFTGRYPFRTNVLGALGENDLANAMVSPYEVTLPRLLKPAGYESALFGKFHLGLQGNNPFGPAMTSALGWDYFYGWLDETGDPFSIDTTAGGVGGPVENGGNGYEYSCGFVPGQSQGEGGADVGACYDAKGKCQNLSITDNIPPGRTCRDRGGILDPGESCQKKMPANLKFDKLNGHYVSPLYIVGKVGNSKKVKTTKVETTDIRARTYRGSSVVDGAIDWINKQPKSKPWMASVSFASSHTPVMQPPQDLLSEAAGNPSALNCTPFADTEIVQAKLLLNQRELTTEMTEAMDKEIGRLLVSIGVASYDDEGMLDYSSSGNEDTMIVILGDNGSLAQVVKLPFSLARAKGTAYQTGVWVPLVIAGPLVKEENRQVRSMVNIADLYNLFGEIAGIKAEDVVPRKLDGKPMLDYLTNPEQDAKPFRERNFTQVDTNVQADFAINQPCTIQTACTQIPVSESVCTDNGGIWWGKGTDQPDAQEGGYDLCCEVNGYVYDQAVLFQENNDCSGDKPADGCFPDYFTQQPLSSIGYRDKDFKIVRNTFIGDPDPGQFKIDGERPNCEIPDPPYTDEFYAISEGGDDGVSDPDITVIDDPDFNLLVDKDGNPTEPPDLYLVLKKELDELLHTEQPCGTEGNHSLWSFDGNLDGVIDEKDLDALSVFASLADPDFKTFNSSWYDVNVDGFTLLEETVNDGIIYLSDYDLVKQSLGTNCAPE